jgi:hypothetical protein
MGWMVMESNPGGGTDFLHLPTKPLYNGYWVSSLAVKQPGHGIDHPPHLPLSLKEEESYNCTLVWAFMTFSRENFTFTVCILNFTLPALHKSLSRPVLDCYFQCFDIGGVWCTIIAETSDLYSNQRHYIQTDTLTFRNRVPYI